MKFLNLFGSKKLIAAFATIIATLLVPLVNKKFGLNLDETEVIGSIGAILTVALAYIAAEFKLDLKALGDPKVETVVQSVASGSTGAVDPKVLDALRIATVLIPGDAGKKAAQDALATLEPKA